MTMMRHQFWLTTTAACVSMMCCSSASAQQTAANIRGIVVDQAGKPLAGATVTIRDERTGRVDVAKTSVRGIFIEPASKWGVHTQSSPISVQRRERSRMSGCHPVIPR